MTKINRPVSFRLFNFSVNNIPFINRAFYIKIKTRPTNFSTDLSLPNRYTLKWNNLMELEYKFKKDDSGNLIPSYMDVILYIGESDGSNMYEIAIGRYDLTIILTTGVSNVSFQLQSQLLESTFSFDVETNGGESFLQTKNEEENKVIQPNLPLIKPRIKNGWFVNSNNTNDILINANYIVDTVLKK